MSVKTANAFIWHELMSRDPDASQHFYETVVGLTVQPLDDDPGSYRLLIWTDGRSVG